MYLDFPSSSQIQNVDYWTIHKCYGTIEHMKFALSSRLPWLPCVENSQLIGNLSILWYNSRVVDFFSLLNCLRLILLPHKIWLNQLALNALHTSRYTSTMSDSIVEQVRERLEQKKSKKSKIWFKSGRGKRRTCFRNTFFYIKAANLVASKLHVFEATFKAKVGSLAGLQAQIQSSENAYDENCHIYMCIIYRKSPMKSVECRNVLWESEKDERVSEREIERDEREGKWVREWERVCKAAK